MGAEYHMVLVNEQRCGRLLTLGCAVGRRMMFDDSKRRYHITRGPEGASTSLGFICGKPVLSADTLESVVPTAIPGVLQRRVEHPPMAEHTRYKQAVLQVEHLGIGNAGIKRLLWAWRLAEVAAPPLDLEPLEIRQGSQYGDVGWNLAVNDECERVLTKQGVSPSLDLGDARSCSRWTVENAGPDRTDRMRAVMTVISMEVDARFKLPIHAEQVDELGSLDPGVAMDSIADRSLPLIGCQRLDEGADWALSELGGWA